MQSINLIKYEFFILYIRIYNLFKHLLTKYIKSSEKISIYYKYTYKIYYKIHKSENM